MYKLLHKSILEKKIILLYLDWLEHLTKRYDK